jgi:uncharacterized membrane protein
MKITFFYPVMAAVILFTACSKSDPAPTPPPPPPVDPCLGVVITPVANITHSITGQSIGTITVTSPIGSGFTYSITGSPYQSSVNFFGLAAGTYTLSVKNSNNCVGTKTITINGYGPKFHAVRTLVNGYCGPCHLNGTTNGSKNFDADNDIVNSWDRIKSRAVDGLPSFMPQAPNAPLTAIDKQKIVDWVNAGHRITD